MGATQQIADFVVRPRPEHSPNGAAVGRVLADTVAVAIAGLDSDAARILLDQVAAEPSVGRAAVWGSELRLAPSQAALVNGTTGHALDWDDAVPAKPMHPGTVLLPALLALATPQTTGGRLVQAYDVGSAVFHAVSDTLPIGDHYGRGFHNTSSTGRLAATAACAYLLGLDEAQTRHALGIVASQVAGSLANFGTMTKPLHAGLAARDAVTAVGLAARGFTAHEHQLEAPRGFYGMYGATTPELLARLPELLDRWEHGWVEDWAIKRHPSCFATHRSVDAALELSAELAADPSARRPAGDVDTITVSRPAAEASPLITHLPRTGLEGKFSLEYTVARALVSGRLELADFATERVADPEVRPLLDRFVIDQRVEPGEGPHTVVTVTLADGRTVSRGVEVTYGDARNPLGDADLTAKVRSALAAAGWKADEADALCAHLRALPDATALGDLDDVLGVRK